MNERNSKNNYIFLITSNIHRKNVQSSFVYVLRVDYHFSKTVSRTGQRQQIVSKKLWKETIKLSAISLWSLWHVVLAGKLFIADSAAILCWRQTARLLQWFDCNNEALRTKLFRNQIWNIFLKNKTSLYIYFRNNKVSG